MERVFFDSWDGLARVALVGVCAYVWLIFLIRVLGKRTLSTLNAFDLVVTVALGSTLATVLLSKQVAFVEGALALALLLGLQYTVASLSARSPRVQKLVKAEPRLLFHQGRFLETAMREERVTKEEILAVVRSHGEADLQTVAAVVLETNGKFSLLCGETSRPASALANVNAQP